MVVVMDMVFAVVFVVDMNVAMDMVLVLDCEGMNLVGCTLVFIHKPKVFVEKSNYITVYDTYSTLYICTIGQMTLHLSLIYSSG